MPSSTNNYRIWARRSDQHLATLQVGYDPDVLTANWVDRTPGNPPASRLVNQRGIDAISWENAAGQWEEHAVYVGGDGRLYDWRLLDGLPSGNEWLPITPEAGHPLTGFVAIARRGDRVFLFATTTDFRLYAWEVINWDAGTNNRYLLAAAGVSSSTMITASTAFDGSYVRVFFNKTDNTIWTAKYAGVSPWPATSFAGPRNPNPDTAAPCALLAAAEGNTGTAGYKTYLFCTRTGGTPHSARIYYRAASGSGSMDFGAWDGTAWSNKATPWGSVSTSGFRLTARRRTEGAGSTIEAFHLGSSYQDLYQVEHTAGAGGLGAMTHLGWDRESTAHPGGIVAAGPDARLDSDAFFVGQAHSASWLYRRTPNAAGGDPWMNYGSGESWKTYATGTIATESSTAMFGGRVLVAAVYGCADPATCPGADTIWDIKTLWSSNEGDAFNPLLQVTPPPGLPPPPWDPTPGGSGDTWKHSFDPVVDFDDSGRAYLIHLTKVMDKNGQPRGSGIFLWTSDNGTFTYQGMLDANIPNGCDHPWVAVRRDRNGVDQVHVAWEVAGSVKYVQAPVNDLADLFDPANAVLITAGGLSIPRVTVSQGNIEDAYVVTPQMICRIPEGPDEEDGADDHGCYGYEEFGEPYKSDTDETLYFEGTDRTVRAIRNFSVATSWENPHRVYYAWQKREQGIPEGSGPFDMRVASLDYDPIAGVINLGPIHSAMFPANDGVPQAFPELTVSQGPGLWNEIAYLSWYDWGYGLTCNSLDEDTGVWAVRAGRCYQVRSAISFDRGLSWAGIGPNPFPWVSDPFYAPVMTGAGGPPYDARFLGDYHAVTGDLLHAAHIAIVMPVGSTDDEHANNVERGWMSDGFWYPYY